MQVTITKTAEAQPMGKYKPTDVDARKAAADFLLVDVSCGNYIIWRDGRKETVNNSRLAKLQDKHTWATDF